MLQRKQTLWLLCAAACAVLTLKFPFYSGHKLDAAKGAGTDMLTAVSTIPLLLTGVVLALGCLINIFGFKNRKRQLWITIALIVVSLLNIPSDAPVYESAGFDFLCLPIPDGGTPTLLQVELFVGFVAKHHDRGQAVAIHCEAGLGRTGTMLAAYLIAQGKSAAAAIGQVRTAESSAVETERQIQFLEQYAEGIHGKN